MKLIITGHRPKDLNNEYDHRGPLSRCLWDEIKKYLILYQPEKIFDGGAQGFDWLVLEVALSIGFKVTLAQPFEGHETNWPDKQQNKYQEFLSHHLVNVVNVSGQKVTKDTPFWQIAKWMQDRNEWMVNQLVIEKKDKLLACWNGNKQNSGTYNCIRYAQNKFEAYPLNDWFIRIDPTQIKY